MRLMTYCLLPMAKEKSKLLRSWRLYDRPDFHFCCIVTILSGGRDDDAPLSCYSSCRGNRAHSHTKHFKGATPRVEYIVTAVDT